VVGGTLLAKGDAFVLTLPDRGAFELCEGPMTESMRLAMGGVLSGEKEAFLDELHPHTVTGQALDQGTQVIEVACEPVHAVHQDRTPSRAKPRSSRKLRPGGVPAGDLAGEHPVQDLTVEVSFLVLVQRAHAHGTDPLSIRTGEVGSGHDAVQPSKPGLGVLRFPRSPGLPLHVQRFSQVSPAQTARRRTRALGVAQKALRSSRR
jgi:hypothetical protein